jgi:hypothetical protein
MATKAERCAARERVSAYHESQLWPDFPAHVGEEIDRYRAGGIGAYAADETIHRCHRAAAELRKSCFARGGSAHVELIAGTLDRMTADAETIDWQEHAAPRGHRRSKPCCAPPRGARSVTDRGHAPRRLNARTDAPISRLGMTTDEPGCYRRNPGSSSGWTLRTSLAMLCDKR